MKTIIISIALTLASVADASAPIPVTFLSMSGPCFVHRDLQAKLDRDKFQLKATAQSVNGAGIRAGVLFYSKGTNWLVILRSKKSSCVMIVGSDFNTGV